jgi:hypothetical protein
MIINVLTENYFPCVSAGFCSVSYMIEAILKVDSLSRYQTEDGLIIRQDGEERRVGGTRQFRSEDSEHPEDAKIKVHIQPAEEPDTILHQNIEYGLSERKWRKRFVNVLLVIVLIGSFLGIIIISFRKADEKYLASCGPLTKKGTILYHDQYFPEDDLCPISFDMLKQKDLMGSKSGRLNWDGPSTHKTWLAETNGTKMLSREDDNYDIFNQTMGAYKTCAKLDLMDEDDPELHPECMHPPYLKRKHEDRQDPYNENTFSVCYQCMCSSNEDSVMKWIDDWSEAEDDSLCEKTYSV